MLNITGASPTSESIMFPHSLLTQGLNVMQRHQPLFLPGSSQKTRPVWTGCNYFDTLWFAGIGVASKKGVSVFCNFSEAPSTK